ncbi:Ig-like domain-containing protein, partial [Dolichospermum sp. ST_sed3]|nr:Ig-like domain-containing protein [Dolichospermum sp. ST_sed3]
NNTPPVVSITSPIKNSLYKPGPDTLYSCTATVTDAQHSGAQLKYEWQTILRHNTHEHREAIDNAVNTNTLIQRVGFIGSDVYYWLIELTVTDAAGLSTKDSAKIFPDHSTGGDVTPPLISSVTPLSGATNVAVGTMVTATLNEAIDPATVTSTTFQLRDAGNNLIPASVSTSSAQITLDPASSLAGSVVYTATITGGASGVKDLAGNALTNNYSWSFTTAAVDNIPPTVISVSPASGATGVSNGTTIIANFSEAVNVSTVTGTTFQLRDAGNNLVAAAINTSSGQTTLTPSAALATSTVYTATITGGASGIKDLAGNALVNNYSWSFTTGAVTTQPPVTIQSFTTKTGIAATTHSLTGVPAGALLVLASTADAVVSDCSVSSSPS